MLTCLTLPVKLASYLGPARFECMLYVHRSWLYMCVYVCVCACGVCGACVVCGCGSGWVGVYVWVWVYVGVGVGVCVGVGVNPFPSMTPCMLHAIMHICSNKA